MTKETLLHATDLFTTIQKIEQLLSTGSPAQNRKRAAEPLSLQSSRKSWNA